MDRDIGLLTKYIKILKNADFFNIYKDRDVNKFFWMVCMCGGILRAKKVHKRLKNAWLIYHILSCIIILSFNIYGFLCTKKKNLSSILMLLRPICVISVVVNTHIIFLIYYKSLEKYMDALDEYLSNLPYHKDDRHLDKSFFFDLLVMLLFYATYCIVGIEFFFPFVNGSEVTSKDFYLLILLANFTIILPAIMITFFGLRMRSIYIRQFRRAVDETLEPMKNFSNATLQNLEFSHNRDLVVQSEINNIEERNYHLNLLMKRRNIIYDNFNQNIAYFSKQHKKVLAIHLHVKEFFEIICSIIIFCSCWLQVILGSDIVEVIQDPTQVNVWTIAAIVIIFNLTYIINEYCNVITVLEELVEEVSNEIYYFPWYLLPTKSRKMITLLMGQYQSIPKFRVFWMFPLNASLVPQVLQLGYSYISVLRVLLMKSR